MTRAVVFAYHNVGVRCLRVLLAHQIDIPLVVTHEDAPGETIWFESVARAASERGIPVIAPADPNDRAVVGRVSECKLDFIFSFYYRKLLKAPVLALARRADRRSHPPGRHGERGIR